MCFLCWCRLADRGWLSADGCLGRFREHHLPSLGLHAHAHTCAASLMTHTNTFSLPRFLFFFLPSFFFLPEWQKHRGVLTVISSASLSLFSVKGIFQGNTLLLCGCVCVCVRHVCKWACVFITTGVGWIKAGCVIDSHLHNLCWINLADKHASGLKKKKNHPYLLCCATSPGANIKSGCFYCVYSLVHNNFRICFP